jgi:hypothetical protein
MDAITEALTTLAGALLSSISDEDARKNILAARSSAQGFVFGLFVDIVDFCKQLRSRSVPDSPTYSACTKMAAVVEEVVIQNEAKMDGSRCHGLSIYFPYRTDDPTESLQEFRAKGSTNRPLKGSTNRPLKERTARIEELEEDSAALPRFKETRWNEFIKRGWSMVLATEQPRELDERYSAQRCAENLGSLVQNGKGSVSLDEKSPKVSNKGLELAPSVVPMSGAGEKGPAVKEHLYILGLGKEFIVISIQGAKVFQRGFSSRDDALKAFPQAA